MTVPDAKRWLTIFGDLPDEERKLCKHGHKECSISRDGECLDDVIKAAIPADGVADGANS